MTARLELMVNDFEGRRRRGGLINAPSEAGSVRLTVLHLICHFPVTDRRGAHSTRQADGRTVGPAKSDWSLLQSGRAPTLVVGALFVSCQPER